MKRSFGLFFSLMIFLSVSGRADSNRDLYLAAGGGEARIMGSDVYEIIADTGAESLAGALRGEMETLFTIYNRLFRFDPSMLASPLKVRVFGEKDAYDRYVAEHLGSTRPGAVYLHYNEAERGELVINRESGGEVPPLSHQAFIQFLRGFIPNPPSWMSEGFAVYFGSLGIDENGEAAYEENLVWLEKAKNMGDLLLSPETLLLADLTGFSDESRTAELSEIPAEITPEISADISGDTYTETGAPMPDDFRISSWALVSFLLNSGGDYFRSLTDSFTFLSPDAGAAENSRAVTRRFALWNNADEFGGDFRAYIASRKSYRELMEEGQAAYSRGDLALAEYSFAAAMDQRPSEFAPRYYLGLLSYEGKDYESAELHYLAGLERGGDDALIYYALGVNAAASGREDNAADYLHKAAALDPERYRLRVEELLKKLWE